MRKRLDQEKEYRDRQLIQLQEKKQNEVLFEKTEAEKIKD
jgi:hypothetical protein